MKLRIIPNAKKVKSLISLNKDGSIWFAQTIGEKVGIEHKDKVLLATDDKNNIYLIPKKDGKKVESVDCFTINKNGYGFYVRAKSVFAEMKIEAPKKAKFELFNEDGYEGIKIII